MTAAVIGLVVVAGLGVLVWTRRLRPVARLAGPAAVSPPVTATPTSVSIVIPARDEARNLPALLASLAVLQPPPLEVIVVDDHSTDGTGAIARGWGARVVTPAPLPEGWVGKPWACAAGAAVARGTHLLFTDADTTHGPASLAIALATAEATGAGLVTAVPAHQVVAGWERLQAPFHLLLLIATAAGGAATRAATRRFSIGQYLLFRRDVYDAIGGHAPGRRKIAEDLALASAVAAAGHPTAIAVGEVLRVRMYPDGPRAFVQGWRRSFRDGLRAAGTGAALEVAAVIGWQLGVPLTVAAGLVAAAPAVVVAGTAAYLATALEVGRRQRLVGRFPAWSALLYPAAVVVFAAVSALTTFDRLRGTPVRWKSRLVSPE